VVLITRCLFKSWDEGAALLLLLLLLLLSGAADADNLSTMRISMTITTQYSTISMIVKMTIQHPMMSLFGDHPGEQYASGHQKILSHQLFENQLRQLNYLLHWSNPYILSVGSSVLSRRRRINAGPHRWHPRRYLIKCLNDWICLLMSIFTRGRIQTKPVSIWLHGQLEIQCNMSPWLTMCQASSSVLGVLP